MFLRFVSGEVDAASHVSQGLFQAAYALRDAGDLEEHERLWFEEVVGWFESNLKAPKKVDLRGLPWYSKEHDRVVYWFRDTAHEHIQRMREVATMLSHHGVPNRLLRTPKPGRVVYSDKFQVAAIPHRDGLK